MSCNAAVIVGGKCIKVNRKNTAFTLTRFKKFSLCKTNQLARRLSKKTLWLLYIKLYCFLTCRIACVCNIVSNI